MPTTDVPPGPLGDLKALVYELYLKAGTPRLGQFEALYGLYLDAGSAGPGPTQKWAGNAGEPGCPAGTRSPDHRRDRPAAVAG